jgi:hypothetical protein
MPSAFAIACMCKGPAPQQQPILSAFGLVQPEKGLGNQKIRASFYQNGDLFLPLRSAI